MFLIGFSQKQTLWQAAEWKSCMQKLIPGVTGRGKGKTAKEEAGPGVWAGALCRPQGQFRREPLRAAPQGAWRQTFTTPNSSLSLVEGSFCSEKTPQAAGPSGRSHRLEEQHIKGFLALEFQAPRKTLRCKQTKTTGHPTWCSSGEG